jgi:hypothetical protein
MCHNGRKTQEHLANKKRQGPPHPVYFPDLPLCDFWFFSHAKEQLKDRLITDESDLEDKLTDIWGHISRDVLQSVFFEWMERLEWVIEHEGDYYNVFHPDMSIAISAE